MTQCRPGAMRPASSFPGSFGVAFPMREAITRLRYRYWPDHWLGEILSKRWTETAIPVFVLLIVGFWLSQSIHNFLSLSSLADTARQACEIGFIALGMALVVIVGGIDLSVGSMFALTDFCALYTLDVLGWPVPLVVLATIVCGMLLGRRKWLLDRLSAPARLHHDADHADHLPLGLRPADPGLFERHSCGVSRFSFLEFPRRRHGASAYRASRSSTLSWRSSAISS